MARKKTLAVWAVESPKGSGRYKLVWNDPLTGSRRQKRTDAPSRRVAEREGAKLESQLRAGQSGGCSWGEFRRRYEGDVLKHKSRKTGYKWDAIAGKLEDFAASRGKPDLLLSDLTPDMLAGFEAMIRRTMAAGSVASNVGTLRAGLSWAASLGLMSPLPKSSVKRSRGQVASMRGRPLTIREFTAMLKACRIFGEHADEWRFILRLIHWGGLRVGEATDLHWSRRDCHTPLDLGTDAPKWSFLSHQKNRRSQVVAMAPQAAKLLEHRTGATGWVCWPCGAKGERYLDKNTVANAIADIGRESGIVVAPTGGKDSGPKFASSHDLRRSFCAYWAQRVRPLTLMHLARHSSIETTMRYYIGDEAEAYAAEIRRR